MLAFLYEWLWSAKVAPRAAIEDTLGSAATATENSSYFLPIMDELGFPPGRSSANSEQAPQVRVTRPEASQEEDEENKDAISSLVRAAVKYLIAGPQSESGPKLFARDLVRLGAASLSDIQAFEDLRHEGPTIENFKLDLTSPKGIQSSWNQKARGKFVTWYLETREPKSRAAIAERFDVYLRTTLKTAREMREPSHRTASERQLKKKHNTRRHELFKRRKNTLGMLTKHPMHRIMLEALEALGPDGMSDSEDADEPDTWRIRALEWRSGAVTMWLRSLDAHERDAAVARRAVINVDARGGKRVARIAGGSLQRVSERAARRGLHAAAYSHIWLRSINEGQRYALEIDNKSFDFSFPIPKYPYKGPPYSA